MLLIDDHESEICIEPDADTFRPHVGAQQRFMDDYDARYCAFAGGWGAGKSWAGARKLANLHVHNAYDDAGSLTGVDSLIVSQTYQLAQVVNLPQMRAAFDDMGLAYRFISDPKVYAYEIVDLSTRADPSLIYVRSAAVAAAISGFEVGAIWGDEAARWPFAREGEDPVGDPLLQSDGRLRDRRARITQFMLTYTNEGEDTRVYRDFEENPKPDHVLYRGSTRENTDLPPAYLDSQLSQLSPDLAAQYVEGYAAKLSTNSVYSNFDLARNAAGPGPELVEGRNLQLAIDFNKDPGMHAVVGQHLEERELLTAVNVIHRAKMLIKQMMQDFDQLYGERLRLGKFPMLELYGDASGNTGSMKDGESYWDVVRQELLARRVPHRMCVPNANPGVADRANAVNSAFCSATGKVRYLIKPGTRPGCDVLIRDFRQMKWDGNKLDKSQKALSHPSDADGYRVHRLMPIRPPGPGSLRMTGV